MTIQATLNFENPSPINRARLTGQNKSVFDILESGKTITLIQAYEMGISALHSRISDLRNRSGIIIYDRYIRTSGGSSIKEYSLKPFEKL